MEKPGHVIIKYGSHNGWRHFKGMGIDTLHIYDGYYWMSEEYVERLNKARVGYRCSGLPSVTKLQTSSDAIHASFHGLKETYEWMKNGRDGESEPVAMSPKRKPSSKEVLGAVIDLMRNMGVKIDSPYDFENWVGDHASHSQQFATKRFKTD